MSDDILSFQAHRGRRDDDPGRVRCARCGRLILATAARCPECGVHFEGEAQDFLHPSERPRALRARWLWVVVVLVLCAMLLLSTLGPR